MKQTVLPKKIVIVNDNSTDNTEAIITPFSIDYDFISIVNSDSSDDHMPGSKVINAFYKGYQTLDTSYDILCKFDADLIFPDNYLEQIIKHFKENKKTGMAGGFCYIKKDEQWILENLTNKDHIRGALKAYRKACFEDIQGLKPAMGWDTIDELLAQYHNWEIKTDPSLKVKHLKPTGNTYNARAKYKQGEAFYKMRYGFILTLIASAKLAFLKKQPVFFKNYILGFLKAKTTRQSFLVTKTEGKFIRKLRWKKILNKFL